MADFGLKIGLEGEKEFKNSLAEINRSFNNSHKIHGKTDQIHEGGSRRDRLICRSLREARH